jgi:hypothetical protein
VTSNDKNDVEWFPTDKIKEIAKKVGVEVIEK